MAVAVAAVAGAMRFSVLPRAVRLVSLALAIAIALAAALSAALSAALLALAVALVLSLAMRGLVLALGPPVRRGLSVRRGFPGRGGLAVCGRVVMRYRRVRRAEGLVGEVLDRTSCG